ncbi:hypothetical protein CBR_g23108 [Chara braunii]|uniref:Core Histone H2A/H2B/H3 domain-containing protein n=1 Tax=Chara braunii TaxID=69332 RepID=A0A388L3L1_CHABU|nr:hypothetical protein CBR_g23108 [Chara braunii]|eukprot:GBG76894.1 hypothetical protein CBR_g23108 [Chara braunii]
METEDILTGFADGRKEGNSVGGNTADCAEVLATIYAQTAEMMGDGDETKNDAGGSICETEKVGEEREEGGLGSRASLTGCIVKDENVVKTSVGEEYPYDINWVPDRVQPGIVGGAPCFAFKVDGTWVPFPAPKMNTWRNVTLSIMFDRVLRLNDGATPQEKGRYALEMWRSPGKMKKCMSGPPRGQTPAGRKKVNPKAVPATGDTAGARTQVPGRRQRSGMATSAEIRKLQRSTDLCLAFRPFLRLMCEAVREDIALGMGVRFQMTAVRALMEAAEVYLVANFETINEVAIHSKRVTIQVKDMRLVNRLSKPRWVEKYQGMLDKKARAEERQQWMEARQAERDGSRAGAKKRKAVPRKEGHAKKRQLENFTVCAA